jgi:mycothiol system anti-sigma-R factor
MSMPCDSCHHHVYSYLDREIGWLASWRIRRHLRACGSCQDAYGFEEKLLWMIRTHLREDLPPDFVARLRQALSNDDQQG